MFSPCGRGRDKGTNSPRTNSRCARFPILAESYRSSREIARDLIRPSTPPLNDAGGREGLGRVPSREREHLALQRNARAGAPRGVRGKTSRGLRHLRATDILETAHVGTERRGRRRALARGTRKGRTKGHVPRPPAGRRIRC
eukprot:21121-Pelagococcus_subviridis.AAC.8